MSFPASFYDQTGYDLRFDWGMCGLLALAPASDVAIVVDVFSFSTAVDVAVSRGAEVLPYRWKDPSAEAYAAAKGALLAGKRSGGGYSLAPESLESIRPGAAIVLPSPNGSALSFASPARTTFTACLRNAPAVARGARDHGSAIVVIAAGERWDDDSLRPCLEDLLGAGAVLAQLPGRRSPEAELAVSAFERFRGRLNEVLPHCASGRELAGRGYPSDVEIAVDYASSSAVPILFGDRFVDERSARR